ncbi:uncharacterized protein C7orf50 homolog [Paramacrobiotus metropolitanus]|uniref:uncharacterized protein C7orf50 homolog n=1 Tax=Paramacrobiotus metropolitanus TaxID=2943436 RepID=UPI002445FC37|nr:uncharacterized protein C7orf50 homolog [Paramacrobiotus metropolitanus]
MEIQTQEKKSKRQKRNHFEPETFIAAEEDAAVEDRLNVDGNNECEKAPRSEFHDKTEEFNLAAIAQLRADDLSQKRSKKKRTRDHEEKESSSDDAVEESSKLPKSILKNSTTAVASDAEEDVDAFEVGHDITEPTKKIKKPKKTKEEKLKAKQAIDSSAVPAEAHVALQYLRSWKNDRSSWKFQKVRQIWLLRNWKNSELLPDDDFTIFLEYIAPLQGGNRNKTAEEAKAVVDEHEATESYGADHVKRQAVYDRASKVLDALSS